MHFKPVKELKIAASAVNSSSKPYFGDTVKDLAFAEISLRCVDQMIDELHRLTGGRTAGLGTVTSPGLTRISVTYSFPIGWDGAQ